MFEPRYLRSQRALAGLTQPQMAEKIGISQQALSNYERGVRKIPPSVLPDFARAYGIRLKKALVVQNTVRYPGRTRKGGAPR